MQAEEYRLKQGTAATKHRAAFVASIGANPTRRFIAANLAGSDLPPNASDQDIAQHLVDQGLTLDVASDLVDKGMKGQLGEGVTRMREQGGLTEQMLADGFQQHGNERWIKLAAEARSFGARWEADLAALDSFDARLGQILKLLQDSKLDIAGSEALSADFDRLHKEMEAFSGDTANRLRSYEEGGGLVIDSELPLGVRWRATQNMASAISSSVKSIRNSQRVNNEIANIAGTLGGKPNEVADSSLFDPLNVDGAMFDTILSSEPVVKVLQGMDNQWKLIGQWITTAERLGISHELRPEDEAIATRLAQLRSDHPTMGSEDLLREVRAWRESGVSNKVMVGANSPDLAGASEIVANLFGLPSDRHLLGRIKQAEGDDAVVQGNENALTQIVSPRTFGVSASDLAPLPDSLRNPDAGLERSEWAVGTAYPGSATLAEDDKFQVPKFNQDTFWTYHSAPEQLASWIKFFEEKARAEWASANEASPSGQYGPFQMPEEDLRERVEAMISSVGATAAGADGVSPAGSFRAKLTDAYDATAEVRSGVTRLERAQRALSRVAGGVTVNYVEVDDPHMESVNRRVYNQGVHFPLPTWRSMEDVALLHGEGKRGSRFTGNFLKVTPPTFQVGDLIRLGQADAGFRDITGGVNDGDSLPNNSVVAMQDRLSRRGGLSQDGYFWAWRDADAPQLSWNNPGHNYQEVQTGWEAQRPRRIAVDAFMGINPNTVALNNPEAAAQIQLLQEYLRGADRQFVEGALFGSTDIPVKTEVETGTWAGKQAGMTVPLLSDVGIPMADLLGSEDKYAALVDSSASDPGQGVPGTPRANPVLDPANIMAQKRALEEEKKKVIADLNWGMNSAPFGFSEMLTPEVIAGYKDEYDAAIANAEALYKIASGNKVSVKASFRALRDLLAGPSGDAIVNLIPSADRGRYDKVNSLMRNLVTDATYPTTGEWGSADATVALRSLLNMGSQDTSFNAALGGQPPTRIPGALLQILGTKENQVDPVQTVRTLMDLLVQTRSLPAEGAKGTVSERSGLGIYLHHSTRQAWGEIIRHATDPDIMNKKLGDFNANLQPYLRAHFEEGGGSEEKGSVRLPGSGEETGDDREEVPLAAFNRALAIYMAELSHWLAEE